MTTVLTCPACAAPTTWQAPFCAYCRAPLTWGTSTVDLERGEPLFGLDLARDALPGTKHATRRADGALVEVPEADFELWGDFEPKVRDACVAVRGTTLDDRGTFGVYVRVAVEGDARVAYQLKVYPAYRAWRLHREAIHRRQAYAEPIVDWEHSPAIGGVGVENEVELRCADSLLQVVINGRRVAAAVDASFGFGGVAWCAGSTPNGPAKVLLRGVGGWRVS